MLTPSSPSFQLNISGMDCADCALTLEKGLATLPGVTSARVNFATATLDISGNVDLAIVTERIQKLGYDVVAPGEHPTPTGMPLRGGGIFALGRFLLSRRETTPAVVATFLMGVAVCLAWGGFPAAAAALQVLTVILAGGPIALRGLRSLYLARKVTIDLLMSIAALGAVLIGETSEAAMVIVLFAIGEAIEGFTAERARDSLRSLLALRPERATVLRPCMDCAEHIGLPLPQEDGEKYQGGPCPFCGLHETTLPVEEVSVGETVLVKPGERIPVDGRVLRGVSSVNQAPVTGESLPVTRQPGENVFAGTINGEAVLEVEVTQAASDSTISKIVRLVEQAQAQRAPIERFVDRFAAWYTPAVVGVAALVAIIPPLMFGQPFFDTELTHGWLYRALALLIVACPCALVISTPVTIVSAITGLARRGVLVKGGRYLDALAQIRTFAFDKTGTLTAGAPALRTMQCNTKSTPSHNTSACPACNEMLALGAAVERRSTHPLAAAIVNEAEARQLGHRYTAAEGVESLAGKGVRGFVNGNEVIVGSHAFFEANGHCDDLHSAIRAAEADGQTVMVVSKRQPTQDKPQVLGFVGVSDPLRFDSGEALRQLKLLDPRLHTVMLTGDHLNVAKQIASRLGVDEVRAGLLPEDKALAVNTLLDQYGSVAMVGDGVNDAPALATATVGIAMGGSGTAQAMETADLVLMQDNLSHLPDAVRTSRRAMRIIRQNIAFSLGVKAVFLVMTLLGWGTLWMAVFADMGASLLVTANGMRTRR